MTSEVVQADDLTRAERDHEPAMLLDPNAAHPAAAPDPSEHHDLVAGVDVLLILNLPRLPRLVPSLRPSFEAPPPQAYLGIGKVMIMNLEVRVQHSRLIAEQQALLPYPANDRHVLPGHGLLAQPHRFEGLGLLLEQPIGE